MCKMVDYSHLLPGSMARPNISQHFASISKSLNTSREKKVDILKRTTDRQKLQYSKGLEGCLAHTPHPLRPLGVLNFCLWAGSVVGPLAYCHAHHGNSWFLAPCRVPYVRLQEACTLSCTSGVALPMACTLSLLPFIQKAYHT